MRNTRSVTRRLLFSSPFYPRYTLMYEGSPHTKHLPRGNAREQRHHKKLPPTARKPGHRFRKSRVTIGEIKTSLHRIYSDHRHTINPCKKQPALVCRPCKGVSSGSPDFNKKAEVTVEFLPRLEERGVRIRASSGGCTGTSVKANTRFIGLPSSVHSATFSSS